MLKKILLFTLILFSIVACQKTPKNVLSQEKLTQVLVDMELLEGSMDVSGIAKQECKKRNFYYNSVYEKNGVTAAQLDSSLTFYAKKPDKLEKIYTEVNKRLKKLKDDLEKNPSK